MKFKKMYMSWYKWTAHSLALFTFSTCAYQNTALSQIDTRSITDPIGVEDAAEKAVVETVLRNGVVVQVRKGPDIAGGEWMYREEKLTTYQAIAELIRMIDYSHADIIALIHRLGGEPDIEKLKGSLRNIKFAPMDEVVSRNSSGYRENKQMEYEPSTNSIIALKPFFEDFKKLSTTGESWKNLPLKLIELLSIEASHSQKLGLTPKTTLTQSYNFANYFFTKSLAIRRASNVSCGKFGDLETRASDCAWLNRSFVFWPPRDTVYVVKLEFPRGPYSDSPIDYKNVWYDPLTNLTGTYIDFERESLERSPTRAEAIKTCEEYRSHANLGRHSRLGTIDEIFRFNPNFKKDGISYLVEDFEGVADLEMKKPAENFKFRECNFWAGCTYFKNRLKALCVFE